MVFWGVEVKPGKKVIHSFNGKGETLFITQATLGIGNATKRTVVQCSVGIQDPVVLCALLPNQVESLSLKHEFSEADNTVVFSVVGPQSVYLAGYIHVSPNHPTDSESYGINIENSETHEFNSNSENDKYEDSFIDDSELPVQALSPVSRKKGEKRAKDKKRMKSGKLKKKNKKKKQIQGNCSDSKSSSHDADKDDGYLFSIF